MKVVGGGGPSNLQSSLSDENSSKNVTSNLHKIIDENRRWEKTPQAQTLTNGAKVGKRPTHGKNKRWK